MQIPIIILLLLYLMMVTLFVLFSISLVYHALRFGTASLVNLLTLGIYLAGAVFILINSYLYLINVDWSGIIIIF
jgi:hypothetical protein